MTDHYLVSNGQGNFFLLSMTCCAACHPCWSPFHLFSYTANHKVCRMVKQSTQHRGRPPRSAAAARAMSTAKQDFLQEVMNMNSQAMLALQRGHAEESNLILTEALEIAQEGLSEAQADLQTCSSPQRAAAQDRKEAWLLAFSITVGNLGCQLRKCNQSEDALHFLMKAKDAETILYGKPASSTMLNISAVLLGRGDLKEALMIARDCVSASTNGDKVLHITSLHNLAMALAQQLDPAERDEALTVMQRGLAEAETHLGIAHPTTALLRDRCLHPEGWVADTAYVQQVMEARQRGALPDAPALRTAPTTQEERVSLPAVARTGSPVGSAGDAAVTAVPLSAVVTTNHKKSDGKPGKSKSNDPSSARSGGDRRSSRRSSPQKDRHPSEAHERRTPSFVRRKDSGRESSSARPNSSRRRSSPSKKKRKSSKAPKEEEPHLMSEELQQRAKRALESLQLGPAPYPSDRRMVRNPPAAAHHLPALGDGTELAPAETTNPVSALPPIGPPPNPQDWSERTEIRNPMQSAPVLGSPHQQAGQYYVDDREDLMVRDAASVLLSNYSNSRGGSIDVILASSATGVGFHVKGAHTPTSGSSLLLGDQDDRVPIIPPPRNARVRQNFARVVEENGTFLRFAAIQDQTTEENEPFEVITYKQLREAIRQDAAREAQPVTKRKSPSVGSARSVVDDEDVIMNSERSTFKKQDTLALKEAARQKELEEEEQFRIQRLKHMQAEEQERKFKEGLAAIVLRTEHRAARLIQDVWSHWWRTFGKPRREILKRRAEERQQRAQFREITETTRRHAEMKGDWTLSGLPPPIVVVNCKKTWLRKTECLRYLVRKGLHSGKTLSEAEVHLKLSKIQAHVRGMLARKQYTRTKTERQGLLQVCCDEEVREYAASVIQNLFRCRQAKRLRKKLSDEYYVPYAIRIQEWFREVMFDQKARGVDTQSVNRRLNAVVLIQKTWRGYLGRVKYFMAMLRRNMDECRLSEQRGVRLLQRVCRGYRSRTNFGTFALEQHYQKRLQERAAEQAEQERVKEEAKPRFVPPVIPRTEYEKECLERADEVYEQQLKDREEYYVPLYLEPEAARQRLAWQQAIELKPFEVRQRRAAEDLRCQLEVNQSRRVRAAIKIQREFRAWLNVRDSKDRDSDYLTICKGVYHQREYERIIQEKEYLRAQAKGIEIYGDVAAPQHQCVEEVRAELAKEIEASPAFMPLDKIRTREDRLKDELLLQHDEEVLASTYEKDMRRLRQDPTDVKKKTGSVYENPQLRGLPSEGYAKMHDLD